MGVGPGPRPYRRNGATFKCVVCGEPFYRKRSFIERGITKTCGKTECKSKFFSGPNNPAWGNIPSEKTRNAVRQSNLKRPRKPGGYKHTPEAKAKMSAALRERWRTNRDEMIRKLTKPKDPNGPRHRREFTPVQKKLWTGAFCAWCGTDHGLELDHIIPIVAGGINIRENCQTLCRKCNLWKMVFVDRPYQLSMLATKAASAA